MVFNAGRSNMTSWFSAHQVIVNESYYYDMAARQNHSVFVFNRLDFSLKSFKLSRTIRCHTNKLTDNDDVVDKFSTVSMYFGLSLARVIQCSLS